MSEKIKTGLLAIATILVVFAAAKMIGAVIGQGMAEIDADSTRSVANETTSDKPSSKSKPNLYTVELLHTQTNRERVAQGLNALALDPYLTESASAKCEDMITKEYFAHTSPDGIRFKSFIEDRRPSYTFLGENLAINFTKSKDITAAWMDSQSHKDNILTAEYDLVGYAICKPTKKFSVEGYDNVSSFVVQHFADVY